MVGHIIVGVVRDDKIRLCVFYHFGHFISRLFVVRKNIEVVKHSAYNFYSRKTARLFRFSLSDFGKFIGRNYYVPQIARRGVANDDFITAFYAFRKRARTSDFYIVGVRAYCKNSHFFSRLKII